MRWKKYENLAILRKRLKIHDAPAMWLYISDLPWPTNTGLVFLRVNNGRPHRSYLMSTNFEVPIELYQSQVVAQKL